VGADQVHILLLAKNYTGYKNLMKLTSFANLEGFSYKPRIDFELLKQYHEGIIVTTGCLQSQFSQAIVDNKRDDAIALMKKYLEVFGEDLYIELQAHPRIKLVGQVGEEMVKISRELGIPLVATNDVHYINPDDAEAHDALLAVQTRRIVTDKNRLSLLDSPDFYLRSSQEMEQLFLKHPDAVANTMVISDKCNVDLPIGQWILPNYPIPEGETYESVFKKMAREGLKKRFDKITPDIEKRLEYELDVITKKGFATYFLIVQDFVNWAKNEGIFVGPGRGSAAGSLAAYSLKITNINPLQHGLPFERFMNPQRPTPPDIDMDFADLRRDEVIHYVTQKYGEDKVAQIITFGTMEARAAIRDIGRALGMPYSDPDRIAKLIPLNTGIQQAIDTVSELREYYKQENFKKLLDLAMRVEGNVRHSSVHAAGIVISDKPLTEYTPIQREAKEGKIITQYDGKSLDRNVADDAIGLLKMDFLGLRNLSILGEAIEIIQKTQGKKLDLSTIPIDDPQVFKLLASGETTGVFQLESAGMRRVARTLKPSTFSDITAIVALYRPGPMDLINDFIESKHNPEKVVYPHPDLEPVLKETYGILVYQEQALQIANVLAGYSLGEADILRRAIGKKKKEIMDEQKAEFIRRSVEKGRTKAVAEKVWSYIEKFAGYGFNKAHAASYAMIAYQTAYMKVHYTVEYMTAVLSIESSARSANTETKIQQGVQECRRMSIAMLPPDINKSENHFTIEDHKDSLNGKAIRFGFVAIKNVGTAAIEAILEARKPRPFGSFTDFLTRVDSRRVNKKVLECLIKIGAFDSFSNRASLLEQLDVIRAGIQKVETVDGQDGLFAHSTINVEIPKDTFGQIEEYPQAELLSFEKELLGFYLTQHPMANALSAVAKSATKKIEELDIRVHQDQIAWLGGIITQWRTVLTKNKGQEMGFGNLDDGTGEIEFVVFPRTYATAKSLLVRDQVVLLKGKIDERDEKMSFVVDAVKPPDIDEDLGVDDKNAIQLEIPRGTPKEKLIEMGKMLKASPGDKPIVLLIPNGGEPKKMKLPYTVGWNKELEFKIQTILHA
jgi:DNA polymerase-3 subunit alpha